MDLIYLRRYGTGFRGCVIEPDRYLFFQCSPKRGLKELKSYPKEAFSDLDHFMAMMQKFISPPTFLRPPIPIGGLSLGELELAHQKIVARGG